jgi:precorrin-2 dehydrogenase/sirohydrochlorin ferrochelatase
MAKFYPVNLKVEGRTCLVVGGGDVARRKAAALVEAGADVIVVAPDVHPMLKADERIEVRERAWRDTDLHGAFVVIVATDDEVTNRVVAQDAMDFGCLVNVVDCPALSNFIVPSRLTRGDLMVTVSTGGASPSLARKIRESLEAQFGEEYADYTAVLAEVRAEAFRRIADADARMAFLRTLADDAWLKLLRERGREALYEALIARLGG